MGTCIFVFNHKGGCAKTTSVINIAAGLSRVGFRSLVVDLDPQANATAALGVQHDGRTIYGAMLSQYELPILETEVPDGCKGCLHVVPSTFNLSAAERQLVNDEKPEYILNELLEPVRNKYDFILIDCAPALGLLTTNALVATDVVFIPLQPEYFAILGVGNLLDYVEQVKAAHNSRLEIGGVFLTDYNPRVKIHADAEKMARSYFANEMFDTYIRHSVPLVEAAARGVDIFQYSPRSNGALDYTSLVAEIVKRYVR